MITCQKVTFMVSAQFETHSKGSDCNCDTQRSMTITFSLMRNIWCQHWLALRECVTSMGFVRGVLPSTPVCFIQRGLADFQYAEEALAGSNMRQRRWALSLDQTPVSSLTCLCVWDRAPCREIPTLLHGRICIYNSDTNTMDVWPQSYHIHFYLCVLAEQEERDKETLNWNPVNKWKSLWWQFEIHPAWNTQWIDSDFYDCVPE